MKIAVAQTRPVKEDILANLEIHIRLIEIASHYLHTFYRLY
jgi:predicted amidohydrolase